MPEMVVIGVPTYDGKMCVGTTCRILTAFAHESQNDRQMELRVGYSSLLAQGFNTIWCHTLNMRRKTGKPDWFIMLHADIVPGCDTWVSLLIAEATKYDADVMSAVVPIKNQQGLTSTAVGVKGQKWGPRRRLTMTEVRPLAIMAAMSAGRTAWFSGIMSSVATMSSPTSRTCCHGAAGFGDVRGDRAAASSELAFRRSKLLSRHS